MEISKRSKRWIVIILLSMGLFVLLQYLFGQSFGLGLFLLIGVGFGLLESRAEVGIATGYTGFFIKGSRIGLFGPLILFGLGAFGATIIHSLAAAEGAVPAFQASSMDAVIPGTTAVTPVNFGLVLGSFLFGVGLTINEGCGLGTLRNIGLGRFHYGVTFLFLLIGTIPGQLVKYHLDQSTLHDYEVQMYLPNQLGYVGTILSIIILILILVTLARKYEKVRRHKETYIEDEVSNVPVTTKEEKDRLHLGRAFKYLIQSQRGRAVSIAMITLFFFLALIYTGEHLAVTAPLSNVAVGFFQLFGFTFEHPAFADSVETVNNGLLSDTSSVQNFGIIIGAIFFAMLESKKPFAWSMKWKESGWQMISGLLMGFGAVLASGCFVGALYSGIVNLSLSGWVVFASMSVGIVLTVNLLRGRVSTIPTSNE